MSRKLFKIYMVFVIVLISFCYNCFADVVQVSPSVVTQTYGNRQTLIINATGGEEIFYSITGDDPETRGFAYDGPVPLDLTGDVEIKVTAVSDEKKESYVIKYNVDESQISKLTTLEEKNFILKMSSASVVELKPGAELNIPSGFEYSISPLTENPGFDRGRKISISKDSNLDRYFSLVIKKDDLFWNFTVHVAPETKGEFSRAVVPFVFEQWKTVRFTDTKFIYQIDDGLWTSWKNPVEIDRSVSHVIRWQSVDYSPLNPVMTYNVPPIPTLRYIEQEDATMVLTLEGDESYRFSKNNDVQNVSLAEGLYKSVIVDAFQGEKFFGLIPLDIYCQNVCQGTLYASVLVNRKKPRAPEFICSDTSFIKRNDVTFTFSTEDEEQIVKYSVSNAETVDPLMFSDRYAAIMVSGYDASLHNYDFKEYDDSVISLKADDENTTVFVIAYYSIDKWNNVSDVKEYAVVIDKCNFFVSENSSSSVADGTKENPFTNLDDIEAVVNDRKFTRFYINGKVNFPDKKVSLKHDVEFVGDKYSKIHFSDKSAMVLSAANCSFKNIAIDSVCPDSDETSVLFYGSDAVFSLDGSEVSFARYKNATLMNFSKSVISVKDSILSSCANDYSCILSVLNSKVDVSSSRLSTVSATCVNISAKKTELNFINSRCRVTGTMGRIAELYSTSGQISGNVFEAENPDENSSGLKPVEPVWKDKKSSVVYKASSNTIKGFNQE